MGRAEGVQGREGRKCSWAGWVFGNAASDRTARWGLLPIRLMLAVIFIVHGASKAFNWPNTGMPGGWAATVGMVRDGMHWPAPEVFAALLIAAELVGGIFLLLGVAPRIGAFGIGAAMVIGLLTVHRGDGFFKTHLQQLMVAAALTLMIAGSGALSVQKSGRGAAEGDG